MVRRIATGLLATLTLAGCGRPANGGLSDSLPLALQLPLDRGDSSVSRLRIQGPVQFVLGDSVFSQPGAPDIEGFDSTGKAVTVFPAMVKILDTTVATIHDGVVAPRH